MQPRAETLGRQPLAEALDHQRQRRRARYVELDAIDAQLLVPPADWRSQRGRSTLRQHLDLGLAEQPVAGVVLAEDLEEQRLDEDRA